MRRTTSLLVALWAAAGVAGCGSDPVSGPGSVEAVLVSASGAPAGVHLVLEGPGIGRISAADGVVVVDRSASGVTVVAVRENAGEIRLRVALDDVAVLPTAQVVAVVDTGNQALAPLSDHRVEWER